MLLTCDDTLNCVGVYITQIYEGTNQICRMVMGRQILG